MRKYIACFLFVIASLHGQAQKFETDIFNDLKYESQNGIYHASLKKNIFDDLIFSDDKDNTITLKKKYLELKYGNSLEDSVKLDLFKSLIYEVHHQAKYHETYSVDILGKIIIEDNMNRKVEIGRDIFGNQTYTEENNGQRSAVNKTLSGALEYKSNDGQATLQKDFFDNWVYKDSRGNEFKFSRDTWNGLKNRFGTDECILFYLVEEFLHI